MISVGGINRFKIVPFTMVSIFGIVFRMMVLFRLPVIDRWGGGIINPLKKTGKASNFSLVVLRVLYDFQSCFHFTACSLGDY